jgi:hypothetical protein
MDRRAAEYASPHVVNMLIGNKTDLDAVRIIPAESAEAIAGSFPPTPRFLSMNPKRRLLRSALVTFGCPIFSLAEDGMMYMETSALNAFNVDPAFESVLTKIYHMETSKHIEPSSTSSARSLRMQ